MRKILSFIFISFFIITNSFAQSNPNIFTYTVGKCTVYTLSEGQSQGNSSILTNATATTINKTIPDGTFPNATNSFLIKTAEKSYILVDTGLGKELINNLNHLGVKPEEIGLVALTHIHGDHVGGLVKDGKAVFPNALIYISPEEGNFWIKQKENSLRDEILKQYLGKIRLLDHNILKDIKFINDFAFRAIAAPGHTPGHTMFLLESEGERLLIWGDITHAIAVQIPYPEVSVKYDTDPIEAAKTRSQVLAFAAEHKIPIAGMHIEYPAIGIVTKGEETQYEFSPVAF
ncbi:MBL fold metallo-hydrolase [Bacteroidales bacterium OttesenSCG-928-M11]|nr:MBL fold metallo-hydrolase [Bacteroidales bacterium OttesenSCG-928-M11]